MRPKSPTSRKGWGATEYVSVAVCIAVVVAVVVAVRYFWWEFGLILGAGLLAFVSLLMSDDESEGFSARRGVNYGLKIVACCLLGAGVGGLFREITRGRYVVALLAIAFVTGLCMGALSSRKAKTRRRSILLVAVALSARRRTVILCGWPFLLLSVHRAGARSDAGSGCWILGVFRFGVRDIRAIGDQHAQ